MGKLLKTKNTWAYFDGISSQINTIGTTSTFGWINQGIFRIEFDIILPAANVSNARVFYTTVGTTNGITILITNLSLKASFFNNTGADWTKTATAMLLNTQYRVVIYGTGTNARLYVVKTDGTYLYDSGETALNIGTPSATQGNVAGFSVNTRMNSYMRNFKIYQSPTNLKHHFTLQDNNNISVDVVGGLSGVVTSLNTKDLSDNGNWAYFNGSSSSANIGTTSTLGWMNAGIFNMQFELSLLKNSTGQVIIYTANSNTRYGFLISTIGTTLNLSWYNGTSGLAKASGSLVMGNKYKVIITGNGSQLQFIILDETLSIVYDSGLYSITFVTNSTTYTPLTFSGNITGFWGNYNIRNFKIYTNTTGTIPFTTLPMQNRDTLMVDTTGGLVGVSSNVMIINSNTNVLKSRNTWASFNGTSSYLSYADNDIFSFTSGGDNDLPFEIEFDINVSSLTYTTSIISKMISQLEWDIRCQSDGSIRVYLFNPTGTVYIGAITSAKLNLNMPYHIKVSYDGSELWSGIQVYFNNVLQTTTTSSVGSYTGMTNGNSVVKIGASSTIYLFSGYLRNLKIKKSGHPVFHTPLQDVNDIGKDVINGISPNSITAVNIVDYNDNGNWLYFNGVNSSANIGTTSTLGWMNTGIFNLQFDVRLFAMTNGNRIFYTSATGGTGRYGFQFILNGTTLLVNWVVNSTTTLTLTSTTPVLGTPYHHELKGNGTQIQWIITNLTTGAIYYDSGLVSCAYTSFATTNLVPQWPSPANQHIRNFVIYSDFAATTPFLTLPMQNRDNAMIDTTGGLIGVANNLTVINNNTNILRPKNLWAKFTSDTSTGTIGTTSTFGWMNTGIFNMQIDSIFNDFTANARTFQTTNTGGVGRNGCTFQCNGTNNVFIWVVNSLSIKTITPTQLVAGIPYRFIVKGNGTQIQMIVMNMNTGAIHYDSGLLACAYVPFATTYTVGYFANGQLFSGYVKNLKIYTDFNGTVPFLNMPMQDGLNIMKDAQGGLQGSPTNIKIIEL